LNSRERVRWGVTVLGLVMGATWTMPASAAEIPYFARKYGVPCATCHVNPPKLNEFGESFRQSGYRMSEGEGLRSRRTVPLAIWASARSDAFQDEPVVRDAVRAYVNKLEVISGGTLGTPSVSYFVEWRPVSLETQKRDGEVRLRDRSGRFEDLYVTVTSGSLTPSGGEVTLTAGQFRQIDQVDVSLRLGLSEPLALSTSLPGGGEGSSRVRSLRGFSPAGRSPSTRLAWRQPLGAEWSWTISGALPIPGELSLPLTEEARTEASNEIEWRPKGVVVESFVRRGLTSFGGHAFVGSEDRLLVQGVVAGSASGFYWTGIAGVDRQHGVSRGRWSAEGEVAPHRRIALGSRLENRAGDGAPAALLPYLRGHLPGTRYTVYLSVEQRIQRARSATLIEVGTVF
jgi:hypothetical protein